LIDADAREPEEDGGPDFDRKTRLALEKEVLGVYLSGHPLDDYREIIENVKRSARGFLTSEQLNHPEDFPERPQNADAVMVGQITHAKIFMTRKTGKTMAKILVEDLVGTADVLIFESVYEKIAEGVVTEGMIVVVRGKEEHRTEETPLLIASKVTPIEVVEEFYEKSGGMNGKEE